MPSRSRRCSTKRDRLGLPPRRGDDGRHREPLAGPASRANVRGTWTVLESAASGDRAGRRRLLRQGLRGHDELPYREDFALQPTAPYEASKAAADLIARSYWHSYGLPVAVTRFANIYGGGDLNFSRLVPEAVCAALDGRAPVLRSDGSPERDFLYVEDAADAYVVIADNLDREEVRGEAFNAGGGKPVRVGDVVAKIAELAGTGVSRTSAGPATPRARLTASIWTRRSCESSAAGSPRSASTAGSS